MTTWPPLANSPPLPTKFVANVAVVAPNAAAVVTACVVIMAVVTVWNMCGCGEKTTSKTIFRGGSVKRTAPKNHHV